MSIKSTPPSGKPPLTMSPDSPFSNPNSPTKEAKDTVPAIRIDAKPDQIHNDPNSPSEIAKQAANSPKV